MSKRIVIVGAGGFGRGVKSWLEQSPEHRKKNHIREVIVIDDHPRQRDLKIPVAGTVRDYTPAQDDKVIVAIGSPQVRRHIVENLGALGASFHTFIDDRAAIAEDAEIGEGAVICPGTVVSAHAWVGRHVHINFNCAVGHDVHLGEFTTLSPMVNIMGEVSVGPGVFVGGSASVLPRIEVGERAVIGAGATVLRSVASGRTVVGNPATVVGQSPRRHTLQ